MNECEQIHPRVTSSSGKFKLVWASSDKTWSLHLHSLHHPFYHFYLHGPPPLSDDHSLHHDVIESDVSLYKKNRGFLDNKSLGKDPGGTYPPLFPPLPQWTATNISFHLKIFIYGILSDTRSDLPRSRVQ